MKQKEIVAWMLNKGMLEVKSKSKEYKKFINPYITDSLFYFVYKNGSVYKGKDVTSRLPVTGLIQRIMSFENREKV